MGGGTQRRNLGIAAIKVYCKDFPQYNELCVEMLVSTAIFLISESEQKDKLHERYNLKRIMRLIKKICEDEKKQFDCLENLQNAINKRLKSKDENPPKGLWDITKDLKTYMVDLEPYMPDIKSITE